MLKVKKSTHFVEWYNQLKDGRARAKIALRIVQTELGNFGDSKSVGDGIFEMRIHYGPGYRLYYTNENEEIVFLLIGGDKSTQQWDIEKAKEIKNGGENG